MYGIGSAVGYAPLRKAGITAGDAQGTPGADRHLLLTGDGLRLLTGHGNIVIAGHSQRLIAGDLHVTVLLDADAFVTLHLAGAILYDRQ